MQGCCEACTLGKDASASGQDCSASLGLGPPYDTVFSACCEEPTPKPSEPTTKPSANPSTTKNGNDVVPPEPNDVSTTEPTRDFIGQCFFFRNLVFLKKLMLHLKKMILHI